MEKRAIEDAKVKMAQTEQDAERARLAEEKRLLEKIETGGDITDIMHRRTNLNVETEQRLQSEVVITNQEVQQVELYTYVENKVETHGPMVPESPEINGSFLVLLFLSFKKIFPFLVYFDAIRSPVDRQLAGGFTIELGLTRALSDAFSCLTWKSSLESNQMEQT